MNAFKNDDNQVYVLKNNENNIKPIVSNQNKQNSFEIKKYFNYIDLLINRMIIGILLNSIIIKIIYKLKINTFMYNYHKKLFKKYFQFSQINDYSI